MEDEKVGFWRTPILYLLLNEVTTIQVLYSRKHVPYALTVHPLSVVTSYVTCNWGLRL